MERAPDIFWTLFLARDPGLWRSALPVAKIENANGVRLFGDYSIHAIKYFTQVIKRAFRKADLPKTAVGNVLKRTLREHFRSGRDRAAG
jgi:acyl-CoA synthetase (AMP-forming)/AMP-acid ligase II